MSRSNKHYRATIGLEVHIQLNTKRKMFASEGIGGDLPNTMTGVVSLGLPGSLPTVNRRAVEFAIRLGLACGSKITKHNHFDRKNYTYRDLPKGYQITQEKTPICRGGALEFTIEGKQHKVLLQRIHLEEDTGQSVQGLIDGESVVRLNFNRAGVPLVELVTEPMIQTPDEAYHCLMMLRRLVKHLGISTGRMEAGALRCDANVSLAPVGFKGYGTPVEVKNMNSMRHVYKALVYEISRQSERLNAGKSVARATRFFDEKSGKTVHMREKTTLEGYRYFPEPDIAPFEVTPEWIASIKQDLPLLPKQLISLFKRRYNLPAQDIELLVEEQAWAVFYQQVAERTTHYKAAANWLLGPIRSYMNQYKVAVAGIPFTPARLAELINYLQRENVSFSRAATELLPVLWEHPLAPIPVLIKQAGLDRNLSSETIKELTRALMATYPEKVDAYQKGRLGLLGFFVGQLMRQIDKQADPRQVQEIVSAMLKKKVKQN